MPNPIDDNEKLAAAVGRATSNWAHAEVHLASIFSTLTAMDMAMAISVFRFFRNVPTQREVLLRVAKLSTRCDENEVVTLSSILIDYQKLADHRNEVVHSPFGWETGNAGKIYRMQKQKVTKPGMFPYSTAVVDVAEIEALTVDIKELVHRIVSFNIDLLKRYRGLSLE